MEGLLRLPAISIAPIARSFFFLSLTALISVAQRWSDHLDELRSEGKAIQTNFAPRLSGESVF